MKKKKKDYKKKYRSKKSSLMPREKLVEYGLVTLSDIELLQILLGSGVKGNSVSTISKKLQAVLDKNKLADIDLETLQKIPGLGKAKCMSVLATLEIGRRMYIPRKWQIRSPLEVLPLLSHYSDRDQEYFIVLTLNGANEVISKHVVSVGLLNRTLVHSREVFGLALQDHAASIILAHNHPSGNIQPSKEDIEVTDMLVQVGKVFDIAVLDHIIFYTTDYFSFYGEDILDGKKELEKVG